MKKSKYRVFSLLLIMAFVFIITGCNDNQESENQIKTSDSDISSKQAFIEQTTVEQASVGDDTTEEVTGMWLENPEEKQYDHPDVVGYSTTWICPNCGNGLHLYGHSSLDGYESHCSNCGQRNIYPEQWENLRHN